MNKLSPEQWMGLIRTVLTFVGGFLITQGTASSELVNQIIGAVLTLTAAIWSVVSKKPVSAGSPDPIVRLVKGK